MDWGIAQEYCWDQGGYLAEIMSREEESLLDKLLIEGTSYWIGFYQISVMKVFQIKTNKFFKSALGVYRWEESHKEAEYTYWAPANEPNGGTGSNCILKTYMNEHPGWHDFVCSDSNHGDGYGEQHALCQILK